jgi:hypothetical protein
MPVGPVSYNLSVYSDIKSVDRQFFIVVYKNVTNDACENKLVRTPSESHLTQKLSHEQPCFLLKNYPRIRILLLFELFVTLSVVKDN